MAQSRRNQGLRLPRKVNRFLPMTDDLTDRQRAVLDFIRGHAASEGMPPTLQQIADAFGFRQACAAHKPVRRLQAAGYLRSEEHTSALPYHMRLPYAVFSLTQKTTKNKHLIP